MTETIMNEINKETASLCLMNESLKKHTTYGIGGPAAVSYTHLTLPTISDV